MRIDRTGAGDTRTGLRMRGLGGQRRLSLLRGQPVQHKNGREPWVFRSTTESVWLSLRHGTEPCREDFIEGLGVSNSSGSHGCSGVVLGSV